MTAYDISRTLVKSQPEVWAELEQVERLAELLGDEAITITRSEPESTIEWQGKSASGTIEIASSGWGTKVRLTAETTATGAPEPLPEPEPEPEPIAVVEPEPELEVADETHEVAVDPEPTAETEVEPEVKPGFMARLKSMFGAKPAAALESAIESPVDEQPEAVIEPEPEPAAEPEPEPELEPELIAEPEPEPEPIDFEERLTSVLDHLGSAHKRPFVHNG